MEHTAPRVTPPERGSVDECESGVWDLWGLTACDGLAGGGRACKNEFKEGIIKHSRLNMLEIRLTKQFFY